MSDIFYDRRGHEKYADEIIPLHQKGYFAILVKDEKVLVTYPPQVSVPEFPGGTVSRREDFRGCLYRKLYEETGIEFELDWGEKSYQQIVNYFAEDAALSENTAFMIRLLLSMMLLPTVLTLPSRPGARRKTAMPPG